MAADAILNIRVPRELESRIVQLAAELKIPKSTAARLLLRRALGEPIGLAVIREKVMQVHGVMRARQAQISNALRALLLEMVDDIAPGDESVLPALPSADEYQAEAFEEAFDAPEDGLGPQPVAVPWESDLPIDHGISGGKRTGDATGRRKRR